MNDKRHMLRHFLAALAYRTQKALRDAPEDFFTFRAHAGLRTPHEIICHMTDVLGYARTFFIGGSYREPMLDNPEEQVSRFHEMLESIKEHLENGTPFIAMTPEQILQGPFSDAMSHAGQLSLLRRLHGSPVPPEDFIMADINQENLSVNQANPASPDPVWTDAEGNEQKLPNQAIDTDTQ